MPEALKPKTGLVDSWGRANNRKHADRDCRECGATFRPKHARSKYCSRPCAWKNNGKNNRRVDASWSLSPKGYIAGFVRVDGERRPFKQHRYLMEQHLGRDLLPTEDVHHLNGIKTDNRIDNLAVIDHGTHSKLSNIERRCGKDSPEARELLSRIRPNPTGGL